MGTLFIGGCASSDEHDHEEGEACISDSDCHEDEICHGGFCEAIDEHEEHS